MAKERKGARPGTLFKGTKAALLPFETVVQNAVGAFAKSPHLPLNNMTKADFAEQLLKFIDAGKRAEAAILTDVSKTLEERLHWRADGALADLIKARHASHFMEALERKENTPQSLARYALRELVSRVSSGCPSSSSILAETEAFAVMEFYGVLLREVMMYGNIELSVRDE